MFSQLVQKVSLLNRATWLAIAFTILGLVLRVWNLPNNVMFLGDQGRDASIVASIFQERDLVFIGPVTSVGNMYLGPLYYYFMLPWLMLSYPSPLGPAYAVAIVNSIAIFLTYWWGRKWVGTKSALLASFLLAITATFVYHSRFSWNPNIAPILTLIVLQGLYKARNSSVWYWIMAWLGAGALIQLHYVNLLILPVMGLVFLFDLKNVFGSVSKVKNLFLSNVTGAIAFTAMFLPLFAFDLKNKWLNAMAFKKILIGEDTFVDQSSSWLAKIVQTLAETHGRSMHLLFEVTYGQFREFNTLALILALTFITLFVWHNRKNTQSRGFYILILTFALSISGLATYEHTVFDHYLAFLFPVSALLLGLVLYQLSRLFGLVGKMLVVAAIIGIFLVNSQMWPLQTAGWNIKDMKRTSERVAAIVPEGNNYSLLMVSSSKDLYAQNYRYFLETLGKAPVSPELHHTTDKLIIINEDVPDFDPTTSPLYELVVFPNREPVAVYTVPNEPSIYVLERE